MAQNAYSAPEPAITRSGFGQPVDGFTDHRSLYRRCLRITSYELLVFTNRGTAGKDYDALCEAIDRLAGTRIALWLALVLNTHFAPLPQLLPPTARAGCFSGPAVDLNREHHATPENTSAVEDSYRILTEPLW